MAIDLNSITRVSGSNCDHFTVDINVEGVNKVFTIDQNTLNGIFTQLINAMLPSFPNATGPDILSLCAIKYYFEKGYTLAQLPAKVQIPD